MTQVCQINRSYNGPPGSANGGYACGLFAVCAGPDVVVHLHKPPPLGVGLSVRQSGRRTHVWRGETLLATVAPHNAIVPAPGFVPAGTAERSSHGFRGRAGHPFPTCVVCGPDRTDPAGLRLTPGPVDHRPGTVACLWTPTSTVTSELMWAVLDCPGGWTLDQHTSPYVLSRMTARITGAPGVGETVVIVAVGAPDGDRIARCRSAVFRCDGTELGRADAIWTAVQPAVQ
jgi:hypothetical protein